MKIFLGATAIGFLLWLVSRSIFGLGDPWDATLPVYPVIMVASGAVLSFLSRRGCAATLVLVFLGFWCGQIVWALTQPDGSEARAWLMLGILTTGIGSLYGLLGGIIGLAIRSQIFRRSQNG